MALNDLIRLSWLTGLTHSSGVRVWNTDRLFSKSRITVSGVNDSSISLYVGNPTDGINYFAHEADRFAAAAFESLISKAKSEELPQSYGWSLIQAYYAAFFATHALCRISGWACTKLTKSNLDSVNGELSAYYGVDPWPAGLYLLKGLDGGRQIECVRMPYAGGLSHEALWSLLPTYLDHVKTLSVGLPSFDPEDQVPLERLESFVQKKGGAAWFSTIRNRLNYAHGYGAWHPYHKSTLRPEQVHEALDSWTDTVGETKLDEGTDELLHFVRACSLLVGICRLTTWDLSMRSSSRSPFRNSSARLISIGMA